MLFRKIDSTLIQFALEVKPFFPVYQNQDSAEMENQADSQD